LDHDQRSRVVEAAVKGVNALEAVEKASLFRARICEPLVMEARIETLQSMQLSGHRQPNA